MGTSGLARRFSRYGAAYDSLRRAFLVFDQRNVFQKLSPGETIEEFKSFQEVEAMYATGFDNWSNELLRKGKQEGKSEVLLRQLTCRFGPLGEPLTERVRTASSAELERWLGNFVDARCVPYSRINRAHAPHASHNGRIECLRDTNVGFRFAPPNLRNWLQKSGSGCPLLRYAGRGQDFEGSFGKFTLA